jgi:hypothetical protein
MSIEYYLGDKNKKIFYYLGQGMWSHLRENLDVLQDKEYLELFLLEECYSKELYDIHEWNDIIKYVSDRLTPDLYENFGNSKYEHLFMINDCGDDLFVMKVKRYICVGTRYNEKNSDNYFQDINFYNRHLANNAENKRYYNPELYSNLEEWSLY